MSFVEHLKDLEAKGLEVWLEGDQLRYRAPRDLLTPQLLTAFKQHKDEICALLRHSSAEPVLYPLSHSQRALWFLHHLAPDSAAYNGGFAVRIRSRVDMPALQRAFQALVDRHAALRTTFPRHHREPVQAIHPHQPLCFEQVEAAQWEWDDLTGRVSAACEQPFHLEVGPVMRVALFTRAVDDHILLLTLHHIACDGWSLWLLLDELGMLYQAHQRGTAASLPAAELSYKDYVRWQHQMLASPRGEQLWAYWQRQLAGELPVLNLPTDRPRPPVQTYHGASYPFTLPAVLTERLRILSQAEHTTLYTTLVAAFQVLLHRYTGQEDILLGAPFAGRSHADFTEIVGDVTNPVVLRGSCAGNPSFQAFLTHMQQTVLEALAHEDFPFALLVERLQVVRDPSRSPLFQVMFNFQQPQRFREVAALWGAHEPGVQVAWGGLILEPFALAQQEGQLDLTLEMIESPTTLAGVFKYNADLFDATTMARMAGHFRTLLAGIVAHPDHRITALPLLTEDEQQQLFVTWNSTHTDYPHDKRLPQLFDDQVQRTPQAVAVMFGAQQLTYRQLQTRADALAGRLRQAGVGRHDLVGLCVDRSLEMLVGLLGILKAGAAYLPLDPAHPQKRLAFILQDAGVRVLVTHTEVLAKLPLNSLAPPACDPSPHKQSMAASPLRIVYVAPQQGTRANGVSPAQRDAVPPDELAYVIYTSGSTGTPKGVEIPHRAVVNFLTSMAREPGMTAHDTMLAVTTLAFDIAGLELFLPLIVGGRVVIAPPEVVIDGWQLAQLLRESGATLMQGTPATWRLLIEAGWPGEPHLKMLCGGEALPPELARALLPRGESLWNMYGPTETTIWSTISRVTSADHITLGRPIANTEAYVLSPALQPVPIGVPGELYLGGAGLARGYRHRPDLTTQRFLPHPWRQGAEAQLYKTGDIVAYAPDGQLRYLGRADHQVKIRGYRIELSEVETALSRHPAVRDVVVMARDVAPGDTQLVAYLVADQEPALSTQALRTFLQEELPSYMIPALFLMLDAMPLNPSGKIDRQVLPLPVPSRPELDTAYRPPQTLTETTLVEIWAAVLGVDKVSVEDNLFALGGHSLTAVHLAAELYNRLSMRLPVAAFFQYPTIRELGRYVESFQRGMTFTNGAPDSSAQGPSVTLPLHKTDTHGADASDPRDVERPREHLLGGIKNRLLQLCARVAPLTLRPMFHRWRGVKLGSNVYIGYDAILETSYPWLISIGNDSGIGIRGIIIGHFAGMETVSLKRGEVSVEIGDNVWIGPGVLILPNVKIGDGAVVAAGSTVTASIPAGTFAQGNPAKPIARCGIPLYGTSYAEFIKHLEPLEADFTLSNCQAQDHATSSNVREPQAASSRDQRLQGAAYTHDVRSSRAPWGRS
jgi:amino acid adenylation domain-containing protein